MAREFLTRVQNKRDTSANWTKNNPVILNGEIILVDTAEGELRAKIGDGTKTYTQLPFSDEVLKSLINTVANNVADNTAARHSHSNKDVLDKITGIVTEDNVNSPAHASDLVDYSGFQAGSQQIRNQIPKKTSQLTNDSDYVTATDLEGKVDKVTGKTLTTNDLTNTLKSNYDAAYTHSTSAHAPADAEKNVIVGVQKNGTDVSINSSTRKVNITIPTKTSDITNDSGFATETYVDTKVAGIVNSAPETLDTLNELAEALGNDPNFATTMATELGNKVDKETGKGLSSNDYTSGEKSKLAGIAASANNYTLPKAGTSLGGVQSGGDVTIANGLISYKSTVPVAKGGTGATSASAACTNLGALPTAGGTMTGPLKLTKNVHYGTTEPSNPATGQMFLKEVNVAQLVYPVGAIYMSTVATNPKTLFGFGTWEQIKDVFLLAAGSTYAGGSTGGEATHTLTEAEMPKHNHAIWYPNAGAGNNSAPIGYPNVGSKSTYWAVGSYTGDVGKDSAHNNMPPYLAVYVWKRTA